ncbi:hypothetical protein HT667_04725 [Ursidibacter maritimus]|uniref:hypothetical protein n=1 Tax=Ursidibacter maritimus TaxID=1331689 RepID=UPI001C4832A1|nr:hypothetical protein [Ursidibacter maritimus]MBV6540773.1 hypothetical protein [Ursidibacter maritimus]
MNNSPLFNRYPEFSEINVETEKSSSTVEYNETSNTIKVRNFATQSDFKSVVSNVLQNKINNMPIVNVATADSKSSA